MLNIRFCVICGMCKMTEAGSSLSIISALKMGWILYMHCNDIQFKLLPSRHIVCAPTENAGVETFSIVKCFY